MDSYSHGQQPPIWLVARGCSHAWPCFHQSLLLLIGSYSSKRKQRRKITPMIRLTHHQRRLAKRLAPSHSPLASFASSFRWCSSFALAIPLNAPVVATTHLGANSGGPSKMAAHLADPSLAVRASSLFSLDQGPPLYAAQINPPFCYLSSTRPGTRPFNRLIPRWRSGSHSLAPAQKGQIKKGFTQAAFGLYPCLPSFAIAQSAAIKSRSLLHSLPLIHPVPPIEQRAALDLTPHFLLYSLSLKQREMGRFAHRSKDSKEPLLTIRSSSRSFTQLQSMVVRSQRMAALFNLVLALSVAVCFTHHSLISSLFAPPLLLKIPMG